MAKRVSIRDVARLAACSTATVSLALKDTGRIGAETTERVLKAATQLGYRPNLAASRLSSKRSRTVGIVLLPILHDAGLQMLYGISEQLQSQGLTSVIEFTGMSYDREVTAVRRMVDEGAEGVLINSAVISEDPAHIRELTDHDIPFVLIDLAIEGIDACYVGQQNETGAFEITQHLIDAGHRRIACVGKHFRRQTKRGRRAGYMKALEKAGLVQDQVLIDSLCVSLSDYVLTSDNETLKKSPVDVQVQLALEETGDAFVKALREILDVPRPPSAFFTVDTGALLSLLAGLTSLGLRVPEDLSVVSFETIPFLSCMGLQVTSVAVSGYQMGFEAARLLIDQIEAGEPRKIRHYPLDNAPRFD